MMHLNFILAALVAGASAVPIDTTSLASLTTSIHANPAELRSVNSPSSVLNTVTAPQVITSVPAAAATSAKSVPSSIWQQHERRVLDFDSVRLPKTSVGAVPLPPFGNGDKTIAVRAATDPVGSIPTVIVPLPTATPPNAHLPRADAAAGVSVSAADVETGCEGEVNAELHARTVGLSRTAAVVPRPHTTVTLNSIKVRHVTIPTGAANVVDVAPKVTGTAAAAVHASAYLSAA
ncbi:hypothetical protein DICSQDRAFT_136623 [Dichomitus squalens LYAD-421 SS1]|uniref:Uncharacterized protein n=1 Tax=Dichomitus squalens (strain LYAD-421) TaxID=732165 RepID=R7T2C0_DICSQ|nr:uncharacterized protein DICSQDRAFT_136623 [Dichomitus squalens LYAD-421 SS1]EJF61442.1 hypothetical protein DICSQDRAFT_136623 [Dichomitus squalens LYAD-421 SS1]